MTSLKAKQGDGTPVHAHKRVYQAVVRSPLESGPRYRIIQLLLRFTHDFLPGLGLESTAFSYDLAPLDEVYDVLTRNLLGIERVEAEEGLVRHISHQPVTVGQF